MSWDHRYRKSNTNRISGEFVLLAKRNRRRVMLITVTGAEREEGFGNMAKKKRLTYKHRTEADWDLEDTRNFLRDNPGIAAVLARNKKDVPPKLLPLLDELAPKKSK